MSNQKTVAGAPRMYWGASIQQGGNPPWPGTRNDTAWTAFETAAGKKVCLIAAHLDFCVWDQALFDHAFSRGAACLLTVGVEGGSIAQINAGEWDARIDAWAATVAAYKRPIMIRPWWEMNGNWGFGWQTSAGVTPAEYVTAWRRFHHRSTKQGTTNLSWVWCPNIWTGDEATLDPFPWWPGDGYVDWIGLDGYNKGSASRSFDALYGHAYAGLAAAFPDKPVVICEVASLEYAAGVKAAWLTDMLERLARRDYPTIRAFLWYENGNGGADSFPIESSPSSQAAFAAGIAANVFLDDPAAGWPAGKVPVP